MANIVVFVRPGEMLESLSGIQFYLIFVLLSCFFGQRELLGVLRPQRLVNQPITICVLGVMACILISHMSNFYFGGMMAGGIEFFKVVVYYLLLVALVTTPERLKILLQTSVVAAAIMIGVSVLDYEQIIDLPKITHVVETHGADLLGREIRITRMCGTGMFHDPNDISLIVVVMSILCIYFLSEPTTRRTRHAPVIAISKIFWLLPLGVLITGLLCTQSRGGLLAMGAALVAWATIKYGKLPAIIAICMGVIAVPLMLGRQGDISLSSGTGQQRVRLWSDGLVAIQNHRIVFGLGEGMYDDVAGLVAHNSYIHAFVELGFIGGTFFFGCFFFAFWGLYRLQHENIPIYHPELNRFKAYYAGILAGYCVGMCSLSRNYIPPTYLICGIATCYFQMIGLYQWPVRSVVSFNRDMAKKLVLGSACLLFCSFMMIKVFAKFN
jgi:hypothetical protein